MMLNRSGEMGFMEAIISMIAVVSVLGIYFVFVASGSMLSADLTESFDPDSLHINAVDGINIDESYLFIYLAENDLEGVSVSIDIPFFTNDPFEFSIGERSALEYSNRYLTSIDYDNGRVLPAIIDLEVYG